MAEGSREVVRKVEYYNLDAIIALGYRVNSYQATQFRIWATKTLREFIIKHGIPERDIPDTACGWKPQPRSAKGLLMLCFPVRGGLHGSREWLVFIRHAKRYHSAPAE